MWGGISNDGAFDLANLKVLGTTVRGHFVHSVELCGVTAIIGAVFGAVLAYAVATGKPTA